MMLYNKQKPFFRYTLAFVLLIFLPLLIHAQESCICLLDDTGESLILRHPIKRVIALIPHATEIVIAAGGQKFLVGTTEHLIPGKLPPHIKKLGNGLNISRETLIALNPDLIIHWQKKKQISKIGRFNDSKKTIFISNPKNIQRIPKTIEDLGIAFQTEKAANIEAEKFRKDFNSILSNKFFLKKQPIVFLQLSKTPIYTITNFIPIYREILDVCGGKNAFDSNKIPSVIVSKEEVIKKNPDAIIYFSEKKNQTVVEQWKAWPFLEAVQNNNIYSIDSDIISRPGPRIILGIQKLCNIIDQVRKNMP